MAGGSGRSRWSGRLRGWLLIAVIHVASGVVYVPAEQPPEFTQLLMNAYAGYTFRASSTLEAESPLDFGSYGMHTLFDGNFRTGWSEGVPGDGIGQVLWVALSRGPGRSADLRADTMLVRNGFTRSERLFLMNNRVRSLNLTLWHGILPAGMVSERGALYVVSSLSEEHPVLLADSRDMQVVSIPFIGDDYEHGAGAAERAFPVYARREGLPDQIEHTLFFLRLEITGVYKGTRWDDTCLTELRLFSSTTFRATRVYGEEGTLLYDTRTTGRYRLYHDPEYLYEPYITDESGRWTLAFRTPAAVSGRVETGYTLFHLPFPDPHGSRELDRAVASGSVPLEFRRVGDNLFLVFDDDSSVHVE